MNRFGAFEEVTVPDSGQNFASGYLRYNPRSVRLAPNEGQAVRIQISKPGLLQPGEYRSHLFVRAEPDEHDRLKAALKNDSVGISVQMVPIFGVSIPVIIRVGPSTAQVTISDVTTEKVSDTSIALKMVFNRTGNMSVYGTVKVDFISDNGKITEVFAMKGIAVYTPTPGRFMAIELKKQRGIEYHSGKLHIMYITPEEEKGLTIAETEFALH